LKKLYQQILKLAINYWTLVDSELSCPVLVAHQVSASSGFVLLWAGWASRRLVHAVHSVLPPSGFKRRFSHL
jgi:hypothetical protein